MQIAIIGGGITGLSAAYELTRAAQSSGLPLHYTLIEGAIRLGGKIQTETFEQDGRFLIEGGPDSFVSQKPWAIELAHELGLQDALIGTAKTRHSTYVLLRGQPCPLPEGTMLVVPTRLAPFVTSPLISPLGKLRMAMDLVIPPRRDDADESLADFIRRRLGSELLDVLAEPIMAGINSAECEHQSLLATFPRFRDIEKKYGSLIRGMIAVRQAASRSKPAGALAYTGSPFVTFKNGIGTLVDALVPRLDGCLLTGRSVVGLQYEPTAIHPYQIRLDDGATLAVDAVILATPAYAAAELLNQQFPQLAAGLRTIRYVSTGTISLVYRRADLGAPLDGFGMVIPRREGRTINAFTMMSRKFPGRAPEEYALIRVFVGGSRTPEALELDDSQLIARAHTELQRILKISAAPLYTRVFRWQNGNPQYDVGHIERIAALESQAPPGLLLAGSAYHGVGIPDCIRQGREAARKIAIIKEEKTNEQPACS